MTTEMPRLLDAIDGYLQTCRRYGEALLWPYEGRDKEYEIDKELMVDNLMNAWKCILTACELAGHDFLFGEAEKDFIQMQEESNAF